MGSQLDLPKVATNDHEQGGILTIYALMRECPRSFWGFEPVNHWEKSAFAGFLALQIELSLIHCLGVSWYINPSHRRFL